MRARDRDRRAASAAARAIQAGIGWQRPPLHRLLLMWLLLLTQLREAKGLHVEGHTVSELTRVVTRSYAVLRKFGKEVLFARARGRMEMRVE